MIRKTISAAALAAGALMGFVSVAPAAPAIVAVGPPPSITISEPMPAPRSGYEWVPGHYAWRNGSYAWISGHWIADRPGYEWREARWVQRSDGSWHMIGGYWVRADDDDDDIAYRDEFDDRRWHSRRFGPNGDLDGDGILNKHDRDRDGDGVANRDDEFPNNPRRS